MPRLNVCKSIVFSFFLLASCGRDAFLAPGNSRSSGGSEETNRALATALPEVKVTLGESKALQFSAALLRSRTTDWYSSEPGIASVNGSGVVRGNSLGTVVITATNAGVSQQFQVVVYSAPPTSSPTDTAQATLTGFVLGPKSELALAVGETRQFYWGSRWSDGSIRAAEVELLATGGSISASGLYTAGSVAGTFMVIANCVCGLSDTALVQVANNAPQLQKLTISPKSVNLAQGATQQFTVSANWSTGATEVPPVTWSASGGTVSSSGVYVAPSAAGTYKVIVKHTGGTVADTAVVTITVNPPVNPTPSGTPFFSDGFESGSWSSANGFQWQDMTRTSISTERAYSGSYSMSFDYPGAAFGQDSWAEQRFDLGRYTKEIWIEYMIYIPSNFEHRDDEPSNNKFLVLWKDTYGSLSGEWQIAWEYQRYNGMSAGRFMSSRWDEPYVTNTGPWPSPAPAGRQRFISKDGPIVVGQWNQIRFMAKAASSRTAEDGESRLWINGDLYFEYTHGRFYNSDPLKGEATLRRGYLLGWANSGFSERTTFFIDDFKVYLSNPGW